MGDAMVGLLSGTAANTATGAPCGGINRRVCYWLSRPVSDLHVAFSSRVS